MLSTCEAWAIENNKVSHCIVLYATMYKEIVHLHPLTKHILSDATYVCVLNNRTWFMWNVMPFWIENEKISQLVFSNVCRTLLFELACKWTRHEKDTELFENAHCSTSQFTIASKVHAWEVEYPIQRLKNSIPVYNMTIVFAVWNPLVTAL